MSDVNFKFGHICDLAFLSADNKINIIGVFHNILSKNFPAKQPSFSIVVNFFVKGMKDEKGKLLFKVLDDTDKQLGKDMDSVLHIKQDEQNVNFIANLVDVTFPQPGKYKVNIYFNDKFLSSIPLELRKI